MTIQAATNDTTADVPVVPVPDPQSGTNGSDKTQQNTQQNDPAPAPSNDAIPKQDVAKLIEKARREEKDKLYPEIDRLKNVKASGEAKVAELEAQLTATRKEVEGLRTGKVKEKESINRELRELHEQNSKLEIAITNVAAEAAAKLQASELEAYKEKSIRKSGIQQLSDLVVGNTKEELDTAIKKAKDKEEAIFKQAREEARAKLADTLPAPLAPDGTHGRGPAPTVTPKQKYDIASLKGEDYRKYRDQLLADAKQKAGLS